MLRFVCTLVIFFLPLLFCLADTSEKSTAAVAKTAEGCGQAVDDVAETTPTTNRTTTTSEGTTTQPAQQPQPQQRALQWDFVSDIIDASITPLLGNTYSGSDYSNSSSYGPNSYGSRTSYAPSSGHTSYGSRTSYAPSSGHTSYAPSSGNNYGTTSVSSRYGSGSSRYGSGSSYGASSGDGANSWSNRNSASSTGSRQCARRGGHCHVDFECCGAMRCKDAKCGQQCGAPHSHCHAAAECCGGLQCNQRLHECLQPDGCREEGRLLRPVQLWYKRKMCEV
eukprot:GHVS01009246.1.p1 GENE.GHVS01009246.1~~GHVS01009246.1.p1  ORF type:complete len:308 (-),score=56.06 GHVS01009246.1:598-1437(-)